MGVVDRTAEFRQILQELAVKQPAAVQQAAGASPVSHVQSQLNQFSAEIGAGIHNTHLKLQELRKMAKAKGIFNDRTHEIQELTYTIKQDIEQLNQKIEVLERQAKGNATNRSNAAHSNTMVDTLKMRILEVTKEFKDALELRTKALESQDNRRQMYNFGAGNSGAALNFQNQKPSGNMLDPESGGMGGGMAQTQLYHNSRADAVQSVQKTIGELSQMFLKMASLVTAQEEMIQRIDHDVDETLSNVEQGQDHLLKYFQHMSSNRFLIMKVFAILIFFVVFFVVFLA